MLEGHHGLLGSLIAVLGIAGTAAAQPLAPVIVIRGATLIDGNGGELVGDATIVIDGGRIAAVGDASLSAPAGAVLIDARDEYLVPGLMDMHVHLRGGGSRRDGGTVTPEQERAGIRGLHSYLYSGVGSGTKLASRMPSRWARRSRLKANRRRRCRHSSERASRWSTGCRARRSRA